MASRRTIGILGSTGSVGTQALEVVTEQADHIKVDFLVAYRNERLLAEQVQRFKPRVAILVDEEAYSRYGQSGYDSGATIIRAGKAAVLETIAESGASLVLAAMMGFAGLKPVLAALEHGMQVALANKETLVAAGELVTAYGKDRLIPVDSEHSALFQALAGSRPDEVERLILTASGGPFRNVPQEKLAHVTVQEALKHPNWHMGQKITVDSATLMNKGLEVIEAYWLFGQPVQDITVVVHRESIIHSLVEFVDGSVMAQMGWADMKVPIRVALAYPNRWPGPHKPFDLTTLGLLHFEKPRYDAFPALRLAYDAITIGKTMPTVLNAANEVAVFSFLAGKLSFNEIPQLIEKVMSQHTPALVDLETILAVDAWARDTATIEVQRRSWAKC